MTRHVAYKPSKATRGRWIKSDFGGGLCFTLGYDDLERVLKRVRRLKDNENIERVEIGPEGIVVFIGREDDR